MFSKVSSPLLEQLPLWGSPHSIAAGVKRLSDQYIERRGDLSQIWKLDDLARAYLSYFFPLNVLRLISVIREAERLEFLTGLKYLIDFGSGPGTLDVALFAAQQPQFKKINFVERTPQAVNWHKDVLTKLNIPKDDKTWSQEFKGAIEPDTLVVFSYALNEMPALPQWALRAEALLFLEPSTQEAGRNLQALRQKLIQEGYWAWGPCTHQGLCPLLTQSKTDWCHHRIHVELTPALKQIETYLPMKNQTLTYSYLLMRRTPPPSTAEVRVIGDTLYERGKIRQAICRGEKREFLTWLTRHGEPSPLERGQRLRLPDGVEEKGAELRMPAPDKNSN